MPKPIHLPPLYYKSPRGQCAVILLSALEDLFVFEGYSRVTKQEAIRYIGRQHWFAIQDEDLEPYPSQRFASSEPRWHTLIAWARKDSVLRDMIAGEAHDSWGLTRHGRDVIQFAKRTFQSGQPSVSACYLWTPRFKKLMCSSYEPSPKDAQRPLRLYKDQPGILDDVFDLLVKDPDAES